jgi:transposase-like protein
MADEKELNEALDRLLAGKTPEEILGEGGLVNELTKRLMERVLEGELTEHLGYEKHSREGRNSGNSRNGRSSKRVKTGTREIELEVPRDRTRDPGASQGSLSGREFPRSDLDGHQHGSR